MSEISFRVFAVPKPGGSKRAFVIKGTNRAIITDACKKNKEWRDDVKNACLEAYKGELLTGPLKLEVCFIMPRIKGHYNSKGILKPQAPIFHTVKPDTIKLLRSTEDALTGLVWKDDAQNAIQNAKKIYGDKPGAEITISTLTT